MLYGFNGRYTGLYTEISLQTQNTVVSFVCFSLRACTPTYPLLWRPCNLTAHPFIPSTLVQAIWRWFRVDYGALRLCGAVEQLHNFQFIIRHTVTRMDSSGIEYHFMYCWGLRLFTTLILYYLQVGLATNLQDSNIPPLISRLLPNLTKILLTYQRDPKVLTSLPIKLLKPVPFTSP